MIKQAQIGKRMVMVMAVLMLISNGVAQQSSLPKNLNNMILEYSDGNGNHYKVTKDKISYQPIDKQMSSSGLYDGGDPKENSISEKDFKMLYNEFDSIFKNKKIQLPNRIKTSGRLVINEEGKEKRMAIIKRCVEQEQLEQTLLNLIE